MLNLISKVKSFALITSFSLSLAALPLNISAQTTKNPLPPNSGSTFTDLQTQLNDNLKRQSDLQRKISDSQNQERSLANQIAVAENGIALTELKIDETQNRIAQLAIAVTDTEGKLNDTQKNLDYKTLQTNQRIRAIYESSYASKPLELMLQSGDFNSYILQKKYAEAIHDTDVRMITSLKETKDIFTEEKNQLSDQKKQAEDLAAQLADEKNSLNNQRQQKSALLANTKNNEALYQQSLAQIKLDQQAIQAALFNLGTKLGPVNRGDIIAFQGNSGCSTGTHLHFGYLIGGRVVDPMPYLNNGTLGWPESNPTITQTFGANADFYAQLGQPGGHPAIDMAVSYGAPIRAAKSGTAFLGGDNGCPGLLPGTGPGKGIIIDHGDGTKTIYWHIK